MFVTLVSMLGVAVLGALLGGFVKGGSATEIVEPRFDSNYCFKIAKISALVCIALVTIEALTLARVDPSGSRCPDWTIALSGGGAISLAAIMVICIPAAIWPSIVAFRWRKFAQRVHDSIRRPPDPLTRSITGLSEPPKIDFNRLFLVVNIGWCLFCSIPLWLMLGGCATVSG